MDATSPTTLLINQMKLKMRYQNFDIKQYDEAQRLFLERYDGEIAGLPTAAMEDAFIAAAAQRFDASHNQDFLSLQRFQSYCEHCVNLSVHAFMGSMPIDKHKCAMRKIAFAMRLRREVCLPRVNVTKRNANWARMLGYEMPRIEAAISNAFESIQNSASPPSSVNVRESSAPSPSNVSVLGNMAVISNWVLYMLTEVEAASAPSASAFELSRRLHLLRSQTRAHSGRQTSLDFLLHAADLLLWELELPLDRLLFESRAGALTMALHGRLGREAAIGNMGPDAMQLILEKIRQQ
jgi:hypothetical protein